MSSVIAINVLAGETRLLTAECELGMPVRLKSYFKIPVNKEAKLDQFETGEQSPEHSGVLTDNDEALRNTPELTEQEQAELNKVLNSDFDSYYGILSLGSPFYSRQDLPFSEPRKIEQVAALQIHDLLPFDTDQFIIDSVFSGASQSGQNIILSALVPRDAISKAGSRFLQLRQDVRTVTTAASSLAASGAVLFSQNSRGLQALISFFPSLIALVVFDNNTPIYLREFECNSEAEINDALAVHLNCSLARVARDSNNPISKVSILGSEHQFELLKSLLKYPTAQVDISNLIVKDSNLQADIKIEDISWALGVLLPESKKGRKKILLDFGQGQFRFLKSLKVFWTVLQDEIVYVGLAAALGLALVGGKYYGSYSGVRSVEAAITAKLKEAFPGERIPPKGELSFVQDRLEQEKTQLKGLGTPNSISPLEALREFFLLSKPLSNLSIESIGITSNLLSIRGFLAENRELNDLSSILNSNNGRLCKAKVDNRGRSGVKSDLGAKVEFLAEISICEKSEKPAENGQLGNKVE